MEYGFGTGDENFSLLLRDRRGEGRDEARVRYVELTPNLVCRDGVGLHGQTSGYVRSAGKAALSSMLIIDTPLEFNKPAGGLL